MRLRGTYPAPAPAARPLLAVVAPLLILMGSLYAVSESAPASPTFYLATACAAGTLGLTWFLWGDRKILGARPLVDALQGLALGIALGGVFAAGALALSRIPALAGPVAGLLTNAAGAALLPTLGTTLLNGFTEELFFRNTVVRHLTKLGRWTIPAAVLLYVVGTLPMQVPVLALAAIAVGALAHLEVRRTGALVSAIAMHLSWSTLMVMGLPNII